MVDAVAKATLHARDPSGSAPLEKPKSRRAHGPRFFPTFPSRFSEFVLSSPFGGESAQDETVPVFAGGEK
jgi:hypothetical protein